MTDDLRNEIAQELADWFREPQSYLDAAADAILAKLDPDALIVAALEAAAEISWNNDAKAFNEKYELDVKGRKRWDFLQLVSSQNKCMNIIAEDTTDAIRALAADPEARAAIKAKAGCRQ